MSASQTSPASTDAFAPFGVFAPAMEYMVDAAQRSVLFWDVMRQRGNQYREHQAETAPHVLDYEVELLIDGRRLDRPVNYGLVKVVPPSTVELDPTRRRAGVERRDGGERVFLDPIILTRPPSESRTAGGVISRTAPAIAARFSEALSQAD